MSTDILVYDAACQALQMAKSIDEVKDWADKAAAIKEYAREAENRQLEADAAEIRIRAARRLGELIGEQKAAGILSQGGRPSEKPVCNSNRFPDKKTLNDLGVSRGLSSEGQSLAKLSDAELEQELAKKRERESHGGRIRKGLAPPREPVPHPDDGEDHQRLLDQINELTQSLSEAHAEIESLAAIMESNDQVKTAIDEAKKLRSTISFLEGRIRGLVSEKSEATKMARHWKAKYEKLLAQTTPVVAP